MHSTIFIPHIITSFLLLCYYTTCVCLCLAHFPHEKFNKFKSMILCVLTRKKSRKKDKDFNTLSTAKRAILMCQMRRERNSGKKPVLLNYPFENLSAYFDVSRVETDKKGKTQKRIYSVHKKNLLFRLLAAFHPHFHLTLRIILTFHFIKPLIILLIVNNSSSIFVRISTSFCIIYGQKTI